MAEADSGGLLPLRFVIGSFRKVEQGEATLADLRIQSHSANSISFLARKEPFNCNPEHSCLLRPDLQSGTKAQDRSPPLTATPRRGRWFACRESRTSDNSYISAALTGILTVINGARDQLEGKIQERYGYERDRVKRGVDNWYSSQTF